MGFLNGYLVMKLRITPVIATLVTLNLFKGIALLIVPDGLSAIKGSAEQAMPGWINDFARKDVLLGLPWAFWVAMLVIIVLIIVQRKTILGKYAAAIGGNRLAAELSGINAVKMVWLLYIIVGFFAALAGVARASYMSLGRSALGRWHGTELHHRRAAGRNRLLRRRGFGCEDNHRRPHHYLRDDRPDDRYPRLLAECGQRHCADYCGCPQPPAGAGKSQSVE